MANSAMVGRRTKDEEEDGMMEEPRALITENCLEIEASTPSQIDLLRSWMDLVNGAMHPQPYLAEDTPGHFRLYVGPAAERARTTKGVC